MTSLIMLAYMLWAAVSHSSVTAWHHAMLLWAAEVSKGRRADPWRRGNLRIYIASFFGSRDILASLVMQLPPTPPRPLRPICNLIATPDTHSYFAAVWCSAFRVLQLRSEDTTVGFETNADVDVDADAAVPVKHRLCRR